MQCAKITAVLGLILAVCEPMSARAGLPGSEPAATLSAALGGVLNADIGEAGALASEIDWTAIKLIPGRSVEYRRRVALEMQHDVRSTPATARLAASRGRTAD